MFWRLEAIRQYQGNGNKNTLTTLNDVDFTTAENGETNVVLKSLGVNFTLPKTQSPPTIRIVNGYQNNNDGTGKWVALGYETLESNGSKHKLCSMVVESKTFSVWPQAQQIHEIQKQEKLEHSKNPKAKVVDHAFFAPVTVQQGKMEGELFGYCKEYKNAEKPGEAWADGDTEAYKVEYELL